MIPVILPCVKGAFLSCVRCINASMPISSVAGNHKQRTNLLVDLPGRQQRFDKSGNYWEVSALHPLAHPAPNRSDSESVSQSQSVSISTPISTAIMLFVLHRAAHIIKPSALPEIL
jgi:hypothetical protein